MNTVTFLNSNFFDVFLKKKKSEVEKLYVSHIISSSFSSGTSTL